MGRDWSCSGAKCKCDSKISQRMQVLASSAGAKSEKTERRAGGKDGRRLTVRKRLESGGGRARKLQASMQQDRGRLAGESNPNRIGWDQRTSFLHKRMACGLSIAGR